MSTTAATSGTKVHIRPATLADADAVFSLVEQLADKYDVDRTAFNEAFQIAVSDGHDHVLLVATTEDAQSGHGEAVVGYVLMTVARLLYTRNDTAQIQELIVDVDSRGHGIASELVHAIEDTCRERGMSQLTVASSLAPSFYDRLDYRSTADFLKKSFVEE